MGAMFGGPGAAGERDAAEPSGAVARAALVAGVGVGLLVLVTRTVVTVGCWLTGYGSL